MGHPQQQAEVGVRSPSVLSLCLTSVPPVCLQLLLLCRNKRFVCCILGASSVRVSSRHLRKTWIIYPAPSVSPAFSGSSKARIWCKWHRGRLGLNASETRVTSFSLHSWQQESGMPRDVGQEEHCCFACADFLGKNIWFRGEGGDSSACWDCRHTRVKSCRFGGLGRAQPLASALKAKF